MKKHSKDKESKCIMRTTGKVVEIISSYQSTRSDSGGILYYPVVEYYINGNAMTQRPGVGTNPCRYVVGQSIEISYNPNMPGEIMLDGDAVLRKLANIFSIVGYILFGVGVISVSIIILMNSL